MERRRFLKATLAASLGLAWGCKPASSQKAIGLQIYTLRELLKKDLEGTLKAVGEMGYDYIESFALGDGGPLLGYEPPAFVQMLQGFGLKAVSSHIPTGQRMEKRQAEAIGTLFHNWPKALDKAEATGQKYLVVPYLGKEERQSLDDYRRLAERMNQAGEAAGQRGLRLCYHNHDFEFETLEGQQPYHLLAQECEADKLAFEMDLYWVYRAGENPLVLFRQYPGRFPLWHVKDMAKPPDNQFTAVGQGRIDFQKIFDKAQQAGLQRFFVEQDRCPGNPLDSIRTSYQFLASKIAY